MVYIKIFFLALFCVQWTQAADKYTDENRPYEFGFKIEGEQHRHEKKDENGIIMGEFGFITADGVYHVTVYATDENGNFKILSMKNIRVKPYPLSPGAGSKKEYNLNNSAAPKDSIPEPSKQEKIIKLEAPSPAKSCSHCSLPPTTTLSPQLPKESLFSSNKHSLGNNTPYANDDKTNQINLLQNMNHQQQNYDSRNISPYADSDRQNHGEQKQINEYKGNENSMLNNNFNYQEQSDKTRLPQPNSKEITDSYPQTGMLSNGLPRNIDESSEKLLNQQNIPVNKAQQNLKHTELISNEEESIAFKNKNVPPLSNRNISPISRHLEGPINEDNSFHKHSLLGNKQPNLETVKLNQNDRNTGQNHPLEQHDNHKDGIQINQQELQRYPSGYITNEQMIKQQDKPVDYGVDKNSTQINTNSDRNPKSFSNFIQEAVETEGVANTGPNLYRPSLPNPNAFSGKPELLAAQMQIVDKNTDIHHLNPGESVGLPKGISEDDMSNLLYTFNYTVGFHGHHEKGYTSGAKQGYYFITGRNGIRTRVDYIADKTGFHPKITQEVLDILSDDVPKPETEKDEKYGLKGYEFKWLYFPLDKKSDKM